LKSVAPRRQSDRNREVAGAGVEIGGEGLADSLQRAAAMRESDTLIGRNWTGCHDDTSAWPRPAGPDASEDTGSHDRLVPTRHELTLRAKQLDFPNADLHRQTYDDCRPVTVVSVTAMQDR
jgi:hypothetical protein